MRTLILEIDDDAYQQVFNFMKLVPKCRVLDFFDDETDDKETCGILMKLTLFTILIIFALSAHADKRIYSTDAIGNRQYDKPSYTITDNGRIYETDSIGNKRYDKQSFKIEGNKILPTDSIGNRQYDKPHFEIK